MGARSDQKRTDAVPTEPSTTGDGADVDADDEAPSYPAGPDDGHGVADPARCPEHGTIHPDDRPWLPKLEKGDLAPHPYCPDCGEVKALGGQKGLDRGGLVNLIADLERLLEREGHTVTDVQKRLIFNRITDKGLDDAYGFTRKHQLSLVAEIAGEILGLPETVVMSYLRSA